MKRIFQFSWKTATNTVQTSSRAIPFTELQPEQFVQYRFLLSSVWQCIQQSGWREIIRFPSSTLRNNRAVTFLEPTKYFSSTAYQLEKSTTGKSAFALDESGTDRVDSYITVDKDSITTEVPHSARDEEQIVIFNPSNYRYIWIRPQTLYARSSHIPHVTEPP